MSKQRKKGTATKNWRLKNINGKVNALIAGKEKLYIEFEANCDSSVL